MIIHEAGSNLNLTLDRRVHAHQPELWLLDDQFSQFFHKHGGSAPSRASCCTLHDACRPTVSRSTSAVDDGRRDPIRVWMILPPTGAFFVPAENCRVMILVDQSFGAFSQSSISPLILHSFGTTTLLASHNEGQARLDKSFAS